MLCVFSVYLFAKLFEHPSYIMIIVNYFSFRVARVTSMSFGCELTLTINRCTCSWVEIKTLHCNDTFLLYLERRNT